MAGDLDPLAPILAAHGGAAAWGSLVALDAVLSLDGFLFTARRRRPLPRVRVTAATQAPRFTFHDWPEPGQRGEWLGDSEVRVVGPGGEVLQRRERPRAAFTGLRRELWWDDLDFLYFGAYASWNYLTTPFLLGAPGVAVQRLPDAPPGGTRLRVTFPPSIPTHCRVQDFWFDAAGELLRLDYTADVVGFWARVAHTVSDYQDFGPLRAPTRRLVRPTFGLASPLPFPDIVRIELHELRGR